MEEVDINRLPDDCISTIFSLMLPRDICRCSPVSWSMKSMADSNCTWERFLPLDYEKILSVSVSPMKFSSMKELYFRLCDSILIEGANKIFSLVKTSGKKCYMLSARDLSITWGNIPLFWNWKPTPQSRFPEAAELKDITWLEIHGKIDATMLSPMTTYAAYLIIKFSDRAYGLDTIPSEISVEVGNQACRGSAYLCGKEIKKQKLEHPYFLNSMQVWKTLEGDVKAAEDREDGWMEIELGEFFIDGGDEGQVKMSLTEIKGDHLKSGLIIEGIELRPKH